MSNVDPFRQYFSPTPGQELPPHHHHQTTHQGGSSLGAEVGAEWPQSWSISGWPLCRSQSESLIGLLTTGDHPHSCSGHHILYYYVLKGIHTLFINITDSGYNIEMSYH